MEPRLEKQVAETLARVPVEAPSGFMPDLWVADDGICCSVRYPFDGTRTGTYSLGFKLTDDPLLNGKAMNAVRHRLWLALEMTRLGDLEGLRRAGLLEPAREFRKEG
jgi:hypothetical protein